VIARYSASKQCASASTQLRRSRLDHEECHGKDRRCGKKVVGQEVFGEEIVSEEIVSQEVSSEEVVREEVVREEVVSDEVSWQEVDVKESGDAEAGVEARADRHGHGSALCPARRRRQVQGLGRCRPLARG
jgi:hypothetical protein